MSDYERTISIAATPQKVFGTLMNVTEFGAWWAPADGSARDGGGLRVTFEGISQPLVLQVKTAAPVSGLAWHVTACDFLPDWVGTTVHVTIRPTADDGCAVTFRHEGLTPQLECYDMCRTGWEQYVPSLRDYIETGTGTPYRPR
jgi:uncharacterized protein YndB with AHSA1/START domain